MVFLKNILPFVNRFRNHGSLKLFSKIFLETISCCVKQFRNYDGFKFFENFSPIFEKKEEKHSNREKIEDFKKSPTAEL